MITYYDVPYTNSILSLAFRPKCDTNTDFLHKAAPANRSQPFAYSPLFHYTSLVFLSYILAPANRSQPFAYSPLFHYTSLVFLSYILWAAGKASINKRWNTARNCQRKFVV